MPNEVSAEIPLLSSAIQPTTVGTRCRLSGEFLLCSLLWVAPELLP